MKAYTTIAGVLALAAVLALSGCVSAERRARAERELKVSEVSPGEFAGRGDVIEDLYWWQGLDKKYTKGPGPARTASGIWVERNTYRIAFIGGPGDNPYTADEKKLIEWCGRQMIEILIQYRLNYAEKANMLRGCVDYPSTIIAWKKEMSGLRLTTDNLRVLIKDVRKDGTYRVILQTHHDRLRDFMLFKTSY